MVGKVILGKTRKITRDKKGDLVFIYSYPLCLFYKFKKSFLCISAKEVSQNSHIPLLQQGEKNIGENIQWYVESDDTSLPKLDLFKRKLQKKQ